MILRAEITKMFLDKPAIKRAIGNSFDAALPRSGRYIMNAARWSIRKRKGASKPGTPPHDHAGGLKKNILFYYDKAAAKVIVGAAGFSGSDAPSMLEFGGKTKRTQVKIIKGKRKLVKKTAVYKKRPYIAPALKNNIDKIPKAFEGTIKGG